MRRLINLKWAIFAAIFALTFSFTSCGDDEPSNKLTESLLIGTWTAHRDGITMTLEFAPNHWGASDGWGRISWNDTFKWEIVSKNEISLFEGEIALWVDDNTPYGHILYDGDTYTKTSTSYSEYYY